MGRIHHHAIVVTSYGDDRTEQAHAEAKRIGCLVSDVVVALTNGFSTFMVGPDGSKEDWKESDKGDEQRARFIKWLLAQRFSDGSSPYSWAEIAYGEEEGGPAEIVNSSQWADEVGAAHAAPTPPT